MLKATSFAIALLVSMSDAVSINYTRPKGAKVILTETQNESELSSDATWGGHYGYGSAQIESEELCKCSQTETPEIFDYGLSIPIGSNIGSASGMAGPGW